MNGFLHDREIHHERVNEPEASIHQLISQKAAS